MMTVEGRTVARMIADQIQSEGYRRDTTFGDVRIFAVTSGMAVRTVDKGNCVEFHYSDDSYIVLANNTWWVGGDPHRSNV